MSSMRRIRIGIVGLAAVIIVAIRKPDGRMTFNPSHETVIAADDGLITMGHATNQEKLVQACS